MGLKNKYTVARLWALWELIWLVAAICGYSDSVASEFPWLFPLAATLVGAPIVAAVIFYAAVRFSALANRKQKR